MSALNRPTLVLTALVAATLATAAPAQMMGPEDGPPPGPGAMLLEMFAEIDSNGDGLLGTDEIEAHRAAKFAAADANADGKLDTQEVIAFQEAERALMLARRAAMMIERHDDNGDGTLTVDELGESPLENRFAVIDTDNDGMISKAEIEAAEAEFAEHLGQRKPGQMRDQKGDHKGGGWMGGWFN